MTIVAEEPDVEAQCPRIEELPEEEDDGIWVESFPSNKNAGGIFGEAQTSFQSIRDDQVLRGAEIWGLFRDEDEWELAKWLIKNVGHNQAEEFLKLQAIHGRVKPSFQNKTKLYDAVDSLPGGISWLREEIKLTGNVMGHDGKPLEETLELWYRDPVECIQELLGNPMFREVMSFVPERLFCDRLGKIRRIDEMWTANWWWKIQQLLPEGATVTPVILSSDKTKLSQFRGDKSAWPVYLTIGNIAKDVRRKASSHASILVGYLPIGKFECYNDKSRLFARYQTFHTCMRALLKSLKDAGRDGVLMTCADSQIRRVWPILAAYIADYPEQCLVACCMENRCPIGDVVPQERGAHGLCVHRELREMLELLRAHRDSTLTQDQKSRFNALGLRAVYNPFWEDLPHADIFQCFTPDLLHQLHKGVFKDHLVKWCTSIIGEEEVDARFQAMPRMSGLRHFKNGISGISQWTGAEHKEMEKVFLALIAGAADDSVIKAARALIDFIHLASLQSHTSDTLDALRRALDDFHTHKNAFIEFGGRNATHFNIPKFHMLEHYVEMIWNFGSTDGFNTEWSERLHIDYAKDAYRASNKRDYTIQMTHWLIRQEKVDRYATYLFWLRNSNYQPSVPSPTPHGVVSTSSFSLPSTSRSIAQLPTETVSASVQQLSSFHYHIAETPPLRNIAASTIIEKHGASRFLPALSLFLSSHGIRIVPHTFDRFHLYTQMVFFLPVIPEVSPTKTKNILHVSPSYSTSFRAEFKGSPSLQTNFALVRTGERNEHTDGTHLHGKSSSSPVRCPNPMIFLLSPGLRVAHVRALFQLPEHYRLQSTHPLAYVEWFTPLRTQDPITGMYIISRSTRAHAPYAEVIEASRITVYVTRASHSSSITT
ncbi:hypothetical protein NLI96_g3483 [Meripilus lineatus]|uniref:Uncharacterized protein n=1 Tax=Meripilus lineatus TaxID=2056292 RepID=A0AAD5V8S2_9APHY|nr:hypothetical protein NLI96_g3483 [Physisporinus lineatus]